MPTLAETILDHLMTLHGDGQTLPELVHELTVLRRAGREMPQVTPDAVRLSLETLAAGRQVRREGDQWFTRRRRRRGGCFEMCQLCLDAVKRHWPDLPADEIGTLLWNCTCYPFSSPDVVERQVKQMAEKSGRDLSKAMAIADAETTAAMAQLNQDVPRGAADDGGNENEDRT